MEFYYLNCNECKKKNIFVNIEIDFFIDLKY